VWGYVKGGMGMVSFYFCDAAREAGAVVATGVPVAQIVPGEGAILEGGESVSATVVISNADPRATLRLLGSAADPGWRTRVEQIPIEGCTVKLNVCSALCLISPRAPGRVNLTTSNKSTRR
jgi:phytoene dehydrogenase-like protein